MKTEQPYWQYKHLQEMTAAEWEGLCDGCGKCCLTKLQDADTDEVYYTDLACEYMDRTHCQCTTYATRQQKVPDCIVLTPENIEDFGWLPQTCAYRLLWEGKPLPAWHPLVSGDRRSVHRAQISMSEKTIPNSQVPEQDWEEHIIHWVL